MKFSSLTLGTVQFGMNYGIANTHGKPSINTVKSLLKYAYEHGVTTLDTAPEYGDSERVIGKALDELGLLNRFTIVTKIPSIPSDKTAEEFIQHSIQSSLKRLKMETLNVVLMHNEEDYLHLGTLNKFIQNGFIQNSGISLNTAAYANKKLDTNYIQIPGNIFDHRFKKYFNDQQRQIFIRSVYLQGLLVMPEENITIKELVPYRRKLENIGLPMPELCIRYLFSLPGNKSVLTGVDSLPQLKENIHMSELGPLPKDIFAEINKIIPDLPENWIAPSFWKKQ
ncbi:MAG: aldo/keto reductase [Lentisphaeria bacterium]